MHTSNYCFEIKSLPGGPSEKEARPSRTHIQLRMATSKQIDFDMQMDFPVKGVGQADQAPNLQ